MLEFDSETPWPFVLLEEVLEQRKEFIKIDENTVYKRPRVQVRVQGIVLRDEVPGSVIKTKRQQLCRPQDFLVAEIDAKMGGFGVVPDELEGAIVSSHYFLFEINTSKLDPGFLDFYVKMPEFIAQIEARGSTNYASIRPAQVLTYQIPLPTLPEQRAIAAALRTMRAARDATALVLQQAKELKRSLMRHLFTYGPVSVQDAGKVELQETEIGMMPKNWEAETIGTNFRITSGSTPSRAKPEYWNGKIPWVKTGEVHYQEITVTEEYITELALEETAVKLIPKGTLLMAMYGQGVTRGRVALLGLEATINQACAAFIPKNRKVVDDYFFHVLNYKYEDIRAMGHGAHQTNLNAQIIRDFVIPVPSSQDQENIASSIMQANKKIETLESRVSALDDLFQSMLKNMMSGTVRVKQENTVQDGLPEMVTA